MSKDEIINLSCIVAKVFKYLQNLRRKEKLAKEIQFPKIPPVLSESIAYHVIKEGKILPEIREIQQIDSGGREADMIVKSNSKRFEIEVKATGKSAFQYLGKKDISTDYLIWVHFGEYFVQTKSAAIDMFVISGPSQYFKEPLKITLRKLKETVGPNLVHVTLNLNSFDVLQH